MPHVPFSDLVGKTLVKAEINPYKNEVLFITTEGEQYKLLHFQDCCEGVSIEDIDGDMEDLIGSPILVAEEVSNQELDTLRLITPEVFAVDAGSESFTWTFYKIDTAQGGVCIRWYGESVDLVKVDENGEVSRW